MTLESLEADSKTRCSVYPIWLRFFTFIAAIIAVYMLLGPSKLMPDSNPELPWNEEARILAPGEMPDFNLSDEQPKLTRVLRYRADVEQDDSPRGIINLVIYPDGTIRGVWNGEYDRLDDTHCLIMAASFSGNVDPSKPFIKDKISTRSVLYFITTGTFTEFEKQLSNNQSRNVYGFIYVRGWLYSDYTAVGEIVITENKRSYETFFWAARPSD